ncbi:MAG: tol-pal system-associated acyl-CoA thioesterase [Burkholderiaceae bacterium]|uniref:tol-pal system-associated acyl-CoA thioesterase n=1 Tax=Ottowia sp. TaxID=1898956 RepID=UPI0025CBCE6C|nr:tol-pal system-associated acyl-CoA thioesterase [Ottowia sp.]
MAEFEFPIRIYWEDTDAGGIVFYANYLKFFERARTEWLRARGVQQQQLREQTGGMFVVSECAVKYLRAARLDDELVITARLEEAGRASLVLAQQAFVQTAQGQRGALLSEARIRIGWVDAARLLPARIPTPLLDRLTS